MDIQSTVFNHLLKLWLLQIEPLAPVYLAPPIWTQLLTSLIVGLVVSLALQFLLTNLGVAIALSFLRFPFLSREKSADDLPEYSNPPETSSRSSDSSSSISAITGFSILLTVNLVLFAGSFLAATFSQIQVPISGAIAGIVIWAAYFLLLLWLSSVAVNSVVRVFFTLTTVGFRRILSAVTALFKKSEDDEESEDELMTQEQMLAAVRQEVQMAMSTLDLQPMIQDRLQNQLKATLMTAQSLQSETTTTSAIDRNQTMLVNFGQTLQSFLLRTDPKKLTLKRVERKLQDLMHDQLSELPRDTLANALDRAAIAALLEQRQDLTDKKKNRVLTQIESTWNSFVQEQTLELETVELEPDPTLSSVEKQSSFLDAEALTQLAIEAVKEQVLAQLPKILIQNWSSLAPLALTLTQANGENSIKEITKLIVSNSAKEQLGQLVEHSQETISDFSQSVTTEVSKLRDRTLEQVTIIQQETQNRVDLLTQQTQQRIDTTRKAAAIAVWWLFAISASGAISAGLAGAIAAGFRMQISLPWLS